MLCVSVTGLIQLEIVNVTKKTQKAKINMLKTIRGNKEKKKIELLHGKTNNLHRRKQRRRSASQ